MYKALCCCCLLPVGNIENEREREGEGGREGGRDTERRGRRWPAMEEVSVDAGRRRE
jgi:hypothetical protein